MGVHGNEMQQKGELFPSLAMPNGYLLEHRICADIGSRPMMMDKNVITLVSADGPLSPTRIEALSRLRKCVIINDLAMKDALAEPAYGCEASHLDRRVALVSIKETS